MIKKELFDANGKFLECFIIEWRKGKETRRTCLEVEKIWEEQDGEITAFREEDRTTRFRKSDGYERYILESDPEFEEWE